MGKVDNGPPDLTHALPHVGARQPVLPDDGPIRAQYFAHFSFDETISARFYGRVRTTERTLLKLAVEAGSLGTVYLLCRWIPSVNKALSTAPSVLSDASHIYVVNSFGQCDLVAVCRTRVSEEQYQHFLEDCARVASSSTKQSQDCASVSHQLTFSIDLDPSLMATSHGAREISFLDYRCNRFVLNPLTSLFMTIGDLPRVRSSDVDACEGGLQGDTAVAGQRLLFGSNDIAVPYKSLGELLVDELLHPFNVFQLFSMIVWCFEDYFYYALIILAMTGGSLAITLFETRESQQKLQDMAKFSCSCRVLRDGQWLNRVPSDALVPGDVIDLETARVLPCDAILLNGDAVVDESMLTGETVPLTKSAVSYEEFREFYALGGRVPQPRYTLFSGTRLLRSRPRHGRPASALVVNTGFLTAKGSLIQSILFPRPNKFRFYRDSVVFVGVLGGIAAVGFVFGVIVMVRLRYDWGYIMTRALDLITVVVPPALPATMSVGAIFALGRLKSRDIFCISPGRINVCAKVGLMCFDKTGTLTEEGLDVLGVVPNAVHPGKAIGDAAAPILRLTPTFAQQFRHLVQLMATCHSIQRVNEDLVGDPLDLKMFAFSGWILEEAAENANEAIVPIIIRPPGSESFDLDEALIISDGDSSESDADSVKNVHSHTDGTAPLQEMGIIRCFEFHAGFRRMSVVARELDSERMQVMTKGSPEAIKAICRASTLPPDYDAVLARFSQAGYRVIGCAHRLLPDGTSWLRVQRMPREDVERDLDFLGFLLFENKLKPQTATVLSELDAAGIATVMITGDNLYTAVAVARASGMIQPDSPVFVPSEADSEKAWHNWESLETGQVVLSDADLLPSSGDGQKYTLAMSGTTFDRLLHSFSFETLRTCISRCRVYARMSPQQKQSLVELFQAYGQTVGFCGDGANDCGALKAADVGVSLSAAEASVAAPFTSRLQHIGCVVELLKEGRAALATSFACFKFMALYSMIQFTTLMLMYLFRTALTDGQFVYIDLALIIPFGILLSRYGPAPAIHPKNPTARLISAPVLVSIFGQVTLQFILQTTVAFMVAVRFSFTNLTGPESTAAGNSSLFLFSIFLYSTVALVYSFGYPHRQKVFLPFIIFLVASFAIAILLCLLRLGPIDKLLQWQGVQKSDGVLVLVISSVHLALALTWELTIAPLVVKWIKARRRRPIRVPV